MKLILDVAIKKKLIHWDCLWNWRYKKTNENQWSFMFYIINFTNVFALDNAVLHSLLYKLKSYSVRKQ